jgi:hypothetical protein
MPNDKAIETATAHWDYVGSVLLAHGIDENSDVFIASRFHYITAFEHGWKHGVESMKENGYVFSESRRIPR